MKDEGFDWSAACKRIWCEYCAAITPVWADYMPAGQLNDHGACDLVCEDCRMIIATLHE